MPMNFKFVPRSEGLKDEWKRVLEDVVTRHKAGESIPMNRVPLRAWNALSLRHYLAVEVIREKDENGVVYPVMVAVPTAKALALWREPEGLQSFTNEGLETLSGALRKGREKAQKRRGS